MEFFSLFLEKMKFHSVWFLRRIRWNVSSWRDARPDISGRTTRCGRTGSNAAGSLERIHGCQWSRPWRSDGLLLCPWISCRRYERCAPARSRRSEWKPPEFPRILSSTCLSLFFHGSLHRSSARVEGSSHQLYHKNTNERIRIFWWRDVMPTLFGEERQLSAVEYTQA